jgi:hypothetical protein
LKDQIDILIRARELVHAERERRLADAQLRRPHLCVHNHRQPLDTRPTVEGEINPAYNRISPDGTPTIGLCMLGANSPEEWLGTICEEPIDAQRCPYFSTTQSEEAVLAAFRQDLTTPDWVTANMPELAALLWVLDSDETPKLPWVRRFLLRFRSFKIEPLKPAVDPEKLLSGFNP